MKKLIFTSVVVTMVTLLLMLFGMSAMAQKAQVTKVLSTCQIKNQDENNYTRKLTCKFINKVNAIKNENLTFISIGFDDEGKAGNNGYVFLSNQAELDTFIIDLKSARSKFDNNNETLEDKKTFQSKEILQINKPKYKIEIITKITNTSISKKGKVYFELHICETVTGDGTAYMRLSTDNIQDLLNWLETLKF
jgi:flagellar basal body rod protein FlgC